MAPRAPVQHLQVASNCRGTTREAKVTPHPTPGPTSPKGQPMRCRIAPQTTPEHFLQGGELLETSFSQTVFVIHTLGQAQSSCRCLRVALTLASTGPDTQNQHVCTRPQHVPSQMHRALPHSSEIFCPKRVAPPLSGPGDRKPGLASCT